MSPEVQEDDSLIPFFDVSPEGFPWPADVVQAIEQRRALMADVLIFDILLSLGGIKHPDALYPPRDQFVLERLLNTIETSSYDALKKDSLVYFLLKWHGDGREASFAQYRSIPPQFVALADAYWCLDSGEDVPRAVSLLADARLNRDYTSKILQALSLDADSHKLILRYVRTAKPLLTEPDDIDAYSIALAESSLFEAWQYQRTYPEGSDTRVRLIRNILTWCLGPKPRSKPLTQLLAFPLSAYEQSQLHNYALQPPQELPPAAIPVIQDLVFVRLVQSGQHVAAVKVDRQFTINPIRGKATEQARRVAQERKQTIDEIMAVLPPAERQLLELELDAMSKSAGDTQTFLNGNAGDLSISWETVRSPKANGPTPPTPKAKEAPAQPLFETPIPPIPQRSGAPRFGGQSPATASTAASSSFAAVREMFDAMTKQAQKEAQPLSAKTTDTVIASRNAPATGIAAGSTTLQALSAGPSSAPRRKENVSLFDTVGSANRTANAFYQPPVSAGTKRPLDEVVSPAPARRVSPRRGDVSTDSTADVVTMLAEPAEEAEDVEMEEGNLTFPHIEDIRHLDEAEELPYSLFTPVADSGRSPAGRPQDGSASPPGGFLIPAETEDETDHEPHVDEPEHETEHEVSHGEEREHEDGHMSDTMRLEELETKKPAPKTPGRKPRASRIPRASQQTARMTRTRSAQVEAQLMRSIPGAFTDETEEEDTVPPLPPLPPSTSATSTASRRTTRKTRGTREEAKTPSRATRRSTRLSGQSAESSSPEPVSPERPTRSRKSTRSSGTPAATTTRTTRARKHR